ncbi:MAG TPA: methyltransferase domain-containing protein [Candidatus Saccharimonadales bacterium]|jgi:cyclopropane fatty-acyl-phospholipid synthase-like methyltransferase|nr:methyltransferase domain-containing protein [Candidatus Saccharimonadales bacterium]
MKKQSTPQASVARYYSRITSRLGYRFFLGRSQHFGYYDQQHTNEPSAQQSYHEHFAGLLALSPGMKLLDAGCGQGVVATYLAKNCDADVSGITITPYEVGSAKKLAQKLGVSGKTHFQLADYAAPPFKNASFDRIYTTETLSHAVDVQAVLQQFYRLLKPGGKLVCAEYECDYDKFGDAGRQAAEFVKDYAAIHGIYQFAPGQFPVRLKTEGFVTVHELDWTDHVAPSFKRLEKIARPVAKFASLTKLERYFVNSVSARMYGAAVAKKAFRYKVYQARKPD